MAEPQKNTALFYFKRDKRAEIRAAHPDWDEGAVERELDSLWDVMDSMIREPYTKQAAAFEDGLDYFARLNGWKNKKADSLAPQPPALPADDAIASHAAPSSPTRVLVTPPRRVSARRA